MKYIITRENKEAENFRIKYDLREEDLVFWPLIERKKLAFDSISLDLSPENIFIFTSNFAIDIFLEDILKFFDNNSSYSFLVLSEKAADLLRAGLVKYLKSFEITISDKANSASLVEKFRGLEKNKAVYFSALETIGYIENELGANELVKIPIYETLAIEYSLEEIEGLFEGNKDEEYSLVFYSPSAVKAFVKHAEVCMGRYRILNVYCLGESVFEEVRRSDYFKEGTINRFY